MYCTKLFEALDKRLEEKKSLDDIGKELCDLVDDPRGKAIRLIKAHKGNEYLLDNADWLGYNLSKINNPDGKSKDEIEQKTICPENFGQNNPYEVKNEYSKFFQPDGTPYPGEIVNLLKAEEALPEGKGVQLCGYINPTNNPVTDKARLLKVLPFEVKGYHYLILFDFGNESKGIGGQKEALKRAFADAYMDFIVHRRQWTPFGCKWEWGSSVVDRLEENPEWTLKQEIASWDA